jgi:transposase
MDEGITVDGALTIGLDLGDRFTEGRVVDEAGIVIESFRVRTTDAALSSQLSRYAACRVVLEVGTHSPWVSRVAARSGHEVIVANPRRVRESTPMDLFPGLETLLATIEELTKTIGAMDGEIEVLCRDRYPETVRLRQVPGVGAITALYYVLTIEDPSRFAKSRSVGAYVGLRPRQRDSGEQRPQLRITKAGDRLLRSLLVRCAHYILGPFGPDTDLRRAGLRMAERGGSAAKKRAIVATARRLAVLLHRLWVTGEAYEALRREATQAA